MSLLGDAKIAIRADLTPLKKGLSLARSMTISSMRSIASAIRSMSNRIMRLMRRLAQFIIASIGLSIKAFADFEQQIASVSTMLDKQTMDFLPEYKRELRRMSIEFGESTKTLSKGLYDILSASVDASKALGVLTVSAKAAKAGMTDTAVAADAITTILNSYQMEAEDAGKVSDWLFAIVKKGKTTFDELARNIGKVAGTAAVAGLRFEEVGAAIATMTRAGMATPMATNSVRALLNAFMKPSKAGTEMAKNFGFELKTATLEAIGLTGVIGKLTGATAEQLAQLIPNVRGLAGFAAALKQAEGHANDYEFILKSTGETEKAFDKVTKTTTHSLNQLWQAVKDVGVEVGEKFAPDIKMLSSFLIENKKVISEWAVWLAQWVRWGIYKAIEFIKQFLAWIREGGLWDASKKAGKALGEGLVAGIEEALREKFEESLLGKITRWPRLGYAGLKAGSRLAGKGAGTLTAPFSGDFMSSKQRDLLIEQIQTGKNMERYLQRIAESNERFVGSMT